MVVFCRWRVVSIRKLRCKLGSGALLLAWGLLHLAGCTNHPPADLIGAAAPRVVLRDVAGHPVSLVADASTKNVLVTFSATWCAICKAEVPDLNELHDHAAGLKVIGVVMEESDAEAVTAFCQRHAVRYPVWMDEDGQAGRQFGVLAVPTSFLIQDGVVRWRTVGKIKPADKERLLALIRNP